MIENKDFREKMKNLLFDQVDDFFLSLDTPSQKAITVNFLKIDKEKFETLANFNYEKISDIDNGYYVYNFKIGDHILHHAGIIYSQEPSAMYPVELLDIKENDLVLDLCAAPGGKSIQILEKLNNTGLLVSNEIISSRAKILYENLSRMGFKNYILTSNSPKDFASLNLKFDKILVDAPCGGEGMFRKSNFDFNCYNSDAIETNANRQLSILNSIKDLLKNGGRLVYSTCTYDIRENENVIAKFLKDNPEFKIVEAPAKFKDSLSTGIKINGLDTDKTYRRYPHLHKGEGQYMAILEKVKTDNFDTEDNYFENFKALNFRECGKKTSDIINKNFKNIINFKGLNIFERNDTLYAIPKYAINCEKLNVLSAGVVIGNINKEIIKLNHSFYRSYGENFNNKVNLDTKDTEKYLRGEEMDTEKENGICVVTHQNFYIGGGKVVNGKLKNYYPKELRKK